MSFFSTKPKQSLLKSTSSTNQVAYAIGDIHGCYDLLHLLLAKINSDIADTLADQTPVIIFCGDYVDRGTDSARVLDALCWLKRKSPYEVHFLKGNHEKVMLDYIRDPVLARDWVRFGGSETLRSYGVDAPDFDADIALHRIARDDLLDKLPVAHLRFLDSLSLMITVGNHLFVHAGIRPGKPFDKQSEQDLLWIRGDFLDDLTDHGKIIVHGHTYIDHQPDIQPNRIGIDTGAYETGVLSAVKLDGESINILAVSKNGQKIL